jgi:hypothetical protein
MSALPLCEVLDILVATPTLQKRASWEGFEFTILEGNRVEVVKNVIMQKNTATSFTSRAGSRSVVPGLRSSIRTAPGSIWWLLQFMSRLLKR